VTLAAGFDVNLIAPARLNDVLTASAVEVAKTGRTGVYDITVLNQRGERVAAFRGRSFTFKGKALIDDLPMGKRRAG
jgi:acyl-CoA thioesterase